MIKTSLAYIRSLKPCKDGWDRLLAVPGIDPNKPQKCFPVSSLVGHVNASDILWLADKMPSTKVFKEYANWCLDQADQADQDAGAQELRGYLADQKPRWYMYHVAYNFRLAKLADDPDLDVLDWAVQYEAIRKAQDDKLREMLDG